ncbi:MAG: XRE family transcriptional regulator [Solirubrobacteraceae bacterium]
MSDTAAWVARRIGDARKEKGLSQRELAERTGRTQAAVSLWESGKRTPGLDDLLDLSRALEIEVSRFFPPDDVRQPIGVLLRGTADRIGGPRLRGVVDQLLDRVEAHGVPKRRYTIKSSRPGPAATELLQAAGLKQSPVDVDNLAKDCGALVEYLHMPDGLSGLVFAIDTGAVIAINSEHSRNRQRFSLGHELGHYLLSHHDRFHIDVQDSDVPGYDWQLERLANEFAADLLMPAEMVRRDAARSNDTAQLADRYRISELAMGHRLVNLGLRD